MPIVAMVAGFMNAKSKLEGDLIGGLIVCWPLWIFVLAGQLLMATGNGLYALGELVAIWWKGRSQPKIPFTLDDMEEDK